MGKNIFTTGITYNIRELGTIEWQADYFGGTIKFLVFIFLIVLFSVLWPFGLLPIIAKTLWGSVQKYHAELMATLAEKNAAEPAPPDGNTETGEETQHDQPVVLKIIPITISMLVFAAIAAVFYILSIPIYILGYIGVLIQDVGKEDKPKEDADQNKTDPENTPPKT